MTTEEIATLVGTIIYDAETRTNTAQVLGTYKQLFPGWEVLPVKHSKNNAARATLVFKHSDGKQMANVILSTVATGLFRADKIDLEELAGFPIIYNDTNLKGEKVEPRLFLGLPPQGWIPVDKIVVKAFKVSLASSVSGLETLSHQ